MSARSAALTMAAAGAMLSVGAGVGGYAYGLHHGKALERGRQDTDTVQALRDQFTAHADLVKRSAAANKGMRAATAQHEKANTQTTTEMADALTTTADSRADCVFPVDVMRGLQAARDRAAQAAAGGIHGALPATAASTEGAAGRPGSP